jgi:hypothetical protein
MPRRDALIASLLRTYRALPGLALTCDELAILLKITPGACRAVTRALEQGGQLERDVQGRYRLTA